MSLTLFMPCAGKSTRFNTTKPKYLFTHPNGNLMLIESISGLDTTDVTRIIITLTKEHVENTNVNLEIISNKILELKGIKPEFCILDEFTASQSETIYKTIKYLDVDGAMFIKDCDNYFNSKVTNQNLVCIASLDGNINAINKSYVSLDKFGHLAGIVEKSVISNKFCVGGYSIKSCESFIAAFEKIKDIKNIDNKEIYISHIIQQLLLDGETFEVVDVKSYSDWGTIKDWLNYTKEFKTIFVDLDGVLVENSSEYFNPIWGETGAIYNNIQLINDLYNTGKNTIIITTSRKEKFRENTIKQLDKLGIQYHRIIFDLPHAARVLINDYSITNPFPSATAYCIKRNEDNLRDYLKI